MIVFDLLGTMHASVFYVFGNLLRNTPIDLTLFIILTLHNK